MTELLQKIVDEAPQGIYVLDAERKIVFWSAGAERITGYSREEMVGRHCFEGMLDHIDREGVHLCHDFCPMMATIFDGQSREQPVFLKDRTGQRIPVMVHTEPLFKGQETLGLLNISGFCRNVNILCRKNGDTHDSGTDSASGSLADAGTSAGRYPDLS